MLPFFVILYKIIKQFCKFIWWVQNKRLILYKLFDMTTTKIIQGLKFTSDVTDLSNQRPSDLLAIAYMSATNCIELPSTTLMAKYLKRLNKTIEIVKNPICKFENKAIFY